MTPKIGFPSLVLMSAILAGCASMDTQKHAHSFSVSEQRLNQLSAQISADVKNGAIPGAVILVARNGKIVYTDAIGVQDPKSGAPMKPDAIFRIMSMTKPIVSVGAMMLVEEGKIQLREPASKYFPELKGQKVGVVKKDADGKAVLEEVPAENQMTIQDLLRQTSGIPGYFTPSLVAKQWADSNTSAGPNQTLVGRVGRLAKLPLAHQPGTTWDYSGATNILGAIIERVSGQTLDVFLSERILKPLGMKDTGFWVETAQQGRIAEPLAVDPDTKSPSKVADVRKPPTFLCADFCMVSTAGDYYRFLQMLLNGGNLDGVQILSRKSVDLMTSDHLGGKINHGPLYLPGPGYGFGLGFAVRTAPGESTNLGSVGDYSWSGAYGTYFFVDPKERLIGVLMIQRPNVMVGPYFSARFRTGVYSALD